jgi:hypothetical protein
MSVHKKDLDQLPCDCCGHTIGLTGHEGHLAARCCQTKELHAAYQKGELILRCARCGQLVVTIAVAE